MDGHHAFVYELTEGRGRFGQVVDLQVRTLNDFSELLRAAKRGDEDAFALLWRQYHPGVLRYLMVRAGSDAEDLAADTWCQAIRALDSFEGDENGFRAWLYTSARNRLTDWYRGSHRRPLPVDRSNLLLFPSQQRVEADAEENAATDAALALIAELPPDQAEAVMLRIIAGLDVSAVATIMERSPGAVRVLCHRGLRRLERSLAAAPVDAGSDDVAREDGMAAGGLEPVGAGLHLSEVQNA